MDWLSLGLGAAKIAGGLFSSASSASGAKYAADKSLQATRETNEQNYKIWQEQRQAAIDAWNRENAYNSPTAQRARLEQAGFNPYLTLGDVGNTAGAISQPAATPMQAPSEMAFPNVQGIYAQGINQSISDVVQVLQAVTQLRNTEANTEKTKQDKQQSGAMFPFLLDTAKYGSYSAKYKSESDFYLPKISYEDWQAKKRDNYIGEATKELQIQTVEQSLKNLKAQETIMNLNAKSQEILNKYLDAQQQMDLMQKAQQVVLMQKEGIIKDKTARLIVAQEIMEYAKINGQKLQNKSQELQNQYDERTLEDRVTQQQNVTRQSGYEADKANEEYWKTYYEAGSAHVSFEIANQTAGAIIQTTLIENGWTPDGKRIAGYETMLGAGTMLRALGIQIPGTGK